MQPEDMQGTPSTQQPLGDSRQAGQKDAQEDFQRAKEWANQARFDAEQALAEAAQARRENEEVRLEFQALADRNRRAGWAVALLLLALVGGGLYGYYSYTRSGKVLAEFPLFQQSLGAAGQRLDAAEQALRGWADDWEAMMARVGKVEQTMGAGLRSARDYATEQSAKVQREFHNEMDVRTDSLQASVARLEADLSEDREQLASLQQELDTTRTELAGDIELARQEGRQRNESLSKEFELSRNDLDSLNHRLDRRRLDFEARTNQTLEVAPGITLTVSSTDVRYQRLEGRVHVVSDGRILWLRGHGIQQPVILYKEKDERPYELVFTRVTESGVVGYALEPLWPAQGYSPAEPAGFQSAANAF
jgi:hypothetical protein